MQRDEDADGRCEGGGELTGMIKTLRVLPATCTSSYLKSPLLSRLHMGGNSICQPLHRSAPHRGAHHAARADNARQ